MEKNAFLSPAIKLLNKFTLVKKFALVTILFSIPIFMMGTHIVIDQNHKIRSLSNHQSALEYISALRPLFELIAQTRGMTNAYRNGKIELKDTILKKRAAVNEKIDDLKIIDSKLGKQYQTGNKVRTIVSTWNSINDRAFSARPSEIFSDYTKLIESVLETIMYISEKSDLVLSSQVDTYLLTDTLIHSLPAIAENLGKTRGLGSGIAAKKFMNEKELAKLSRFTEMISQHMYRLKHNYKIIEDENVELRQQLNTLFDEAVSETQSFLTLTQTAIVNNVNISIEPVKYFETGTKAISANLKLYDLALPVLNNRYGELISNAKFERNLMIGMGTLIILVCLYFLTGFIVSIKQRINLINNTLISISEGDLTQNIDLISKDELSQIAININQMAQQIKKLVQNIVETTDVVVSNTQTASELSQQTSHQLKYQSGDIAKVITAAEEMSESIKDIANNTNVAAETTANVDESTKTGQVVVVETIDSIKALSTEMNEACNAIELLENNSKEIGSVLNVIRDIAEQTNLLALNAAIEAARAGEQGRGFAVVADEVRTLAGRTQESTHEIQSIIESLQNGAQNAVKLVKRGVDSSNETVQKANEAGLALENIRDSVGDIKNMSTQVATAIEQQLVVTDNVAENITKIHNVAETGQMFSNESDSASQGLLKTAENLRKTVSHFTI